MPFRLLPLFSLIFLVSCATKFVIPSNRFITPESQGEVFRGQFEIQKTAAKELKINGSNGSVDDGVVYHDLSRAGYSLSASLLDNFDLVWSHVAGGNSMVGGKFQFIGDSRLSNSTGHKMAAGLLFGSNEHESDDDSITFTLSGQELLFLYGYRFTENVFPYSSISFSKYDFEGEISKGQLRGQDPEFSSRAIGVNGGVELGFEAIFAKLECTYQQISTTSSKDETSFNFGFSLGLSW